MIQATHFLARHCVFIVFGVVFLDQMGLPLPAVPWLLAAGAVSAREKWRLAIGLLAIVTACLIADTIWFYVGRVRGHQVLSLLCRFSLEPDSCVRRARNVFHKYGLRGLVAAKFLPGMSTLAPPLAGLSGMTAIQFLAVDSLGSLLYGACFLGFGYCFSAQIEHISAAISRTGGGLFILIIAPTVAFLIYKCWQRQNLLRLRRTARITVQELRQKLDANESLLVLDVRSLAAVQQDPVLIHGATHVSIDDIEGNRFKIPYDRDIVVYCSCPNEVSSAQVALRLQRKGFPRARPLLGGLEAWRTNNYPVDRSGLNTEGQSEANTPVTQFSASKPTSGSGLIANGRRPTKD
jgi:membrane protein DedA with SNARE-associated domain/rhodanese-related sulfurtransferase